MAATIEFIPMSEAGGIIQYRCVRRKNADGALPDGVVLSVCGDG